MIEDGVLLHICGVSHSRKFPQEYRFNYRIFSILIDLDQLQHARQCSRLFSVNRRAAVAFHEADHGPRDGSSLRSWIDSQLADNGIARPAAVLLQCMPRVLGYVFNPISLWYCFDAAEKVSAILVEVNNTFGEKHCYLLHRHGETLDWPVRQSADKCFHVSPFIGMQARYDFKITDPREQLGLVINEYQDKQLMMVATQHGAPQPLTSRALWHCLLLLPLSTLKVTAAIHWQALKIWVRGGTFHKKPSPPSKLVS